jgi:C-terminal processing protease CtpA/Prc
MKIRSLIIIAIFTISLASCGLSDRIQNSSSLRPTGADQAIVETAQEIETAVTAVLEATATAVPQPSPTDTAEPQPTATETGEVTPIPTTDSTSANQAELSDLPPAKIVNDEGGPVSITGEVNYTNLTFTDGVAEPVIILEDQAGFVDRNEFFIMPVESQTLGQITSDFFDPPFTYSIALPFEPQGTLRDVDHDDQEETGVQVFAIAYWENTFGDPYLEARDLMGGGWSTAYASTLTSPDAETNREIIGGKLLIYAPEEGQGFPSGFGEDGLLFTADDPLVALPQGYTVVDLDSDPFTFDRSRHPVINLIEPDTAALVDYSDLSYTEAFDSFVEKLSKEYAFTDLKGLDWQQIHTDLRPLFEEADEKQDAQLFRIALRELARSIPDGHISGPFISDEFIEQTSGGLGIAIRELDDGRIMANFLTPGSPAEEAGIELGAEILAFNGIPIDEVVSSTIPQYGSFSTEHVKRLQQLRYASRFPVGTEVSVTFKNPDSDSGQTVDLTAVLEPESFRFSSLNSGIDGFELPVEYELLPGTQFGYVKINSFSDNDLLSIQLWERMIRNLKEQNIPGLIIDMRQNRGGSGFLADAMAAYFFEESHVLGNTGHYNEELDDFFFDSRGEQRFYLPAEELRYDGEVAVLVGPNCNSACEFFSYDMTIADRAAIVGQYPTAGLGGSIERVLMPEGEIFQFTSGRAVDANGDIHIEGKGVVPTVEVPVNEETLFSTGDPVLEAAVTYLAETLVPETVDMGSIAIGESIDAELEAGKRTQFTLDVKTGDIIDIIVTSEDFDPTLLILDETGNILAANDNLDDASTNAGFSELEIPVDLTLVLQIIGPEENSNGSFTITTSAPES